MIPMKTSSVFKSRWMALLWAAGIVWFAYDVAESAPQGDANSANAEQATDATGAPVTAEDEQRLAEALNRF
jgi:hypothetical protein